MANPTEIVKSNVAQIQGLLTKSQDRIASVIQGHIRADRMVNVALELVSGDSKLCLCEPLSILKCVMEASQLGLLLNKHLGHGYLVPYRNGKLTQKFGIDMYNAEFLIGYRGYVHLVKESDPTVHRVYARIVYQGEPFEITEGTKHELHHTPSLTFRDLKEYIGAYAVILFNNGTVSDFEWMPRGEIEKVKKHAKAKGGAVWDSWEEEQIKKTVIRRLCKRQELSPEITEATVRDESRELGYEGERPAARTVTMPRRMSDPIPTESTEQEQSSGEPLNQQEAQQPEPTSNGTKKEERTVQLVSEEEREYIVTLGLEVGFQNKGEVYNFVIETFNLRSMSEVNSTNYPKILDALNARKAGKPADEKPGQLESAPSPVGNGSTDKKRSNKTVTLISDKQAADILYIARMHLWIRDSPKLGDPLSVWLSGDPFHVASVSELPASAFKAVKEQLGKGPASMGLEAAK